MTRYQLLIFLLASLLGTLSIYYFWIRGDAGSDYEVSPEYIRCMTGIPCVYEDTVDFRIIVITFNRPDSLSKLLRTTNEVELDGHTAALEIWIDRDKSQKVDSRTLEVAKSFKWRRGPTRVHVQSSHAGIYGQWIDTWRPKDTNELALILEDDISVSKYILRWILAVNKFYGSRNDFAGSTLTSDELKTHDGRFSILSAPKSEPVFMYKCIGTWGFSPNPSKWTEFQNWYHAHVTDPNFALDVPGIAPTKWYKDLKAEGKADTMWEMWFIYFAYKEKLFTLYNNLGAFNGDSASCLCINRREVGLHSDSKGKEDYCQLLNRWDQRYITLPNDIVKLDWNGRQIGEY